MTSQEAVAVLKLTGGAFVWRETRMDDAAVLKKELGVPAVSWTDQNGREVSV
jgi:hypothetical protein